MPCLFYTQANGNDRDTCTSVAIIRWAYRARARGARYEGATDCQCRGGRLSPLASTVRHDTTCATHFPPTSPQGFSDGASYALSLGVPNGDLFTHIVAFSPGFMRLPDQEPAGGGRKPKVPVGRALCWKRA